MGNIAVLLVDIGGVTMLSDLERRYRALGERAGMDPARVAEKAPAMERWIQQANAGRISSRKLWKNVCELLSCEIPYKEFSGLWNSKWIANDPFHVFLGDYRERSKAGLYVFSNMYWLEWQWCSKLPVFEIFDDHFISWRLRLVKPDPRIYRQVITKLGVSAEQCLFVDDLHQNVAAAADLGMNVWQYRPETHQAFLDYIRAMGG